MYSAQSQVLPTILSSTDDYANDAGEHSNSHGEHMNARPSYVSLATSWRTSTSTLVSSSCSISSSVLGRGAIPFEEEDDDVDDTNEATKTEEGGKVDDVDHHMRQEREKTLRILTSRADEVDDDEMVRSDAGGLIHGDGQCGKVKEVTGFADVGKEKSELGEDEFSGTLISYIRGHEVTCSRL